MTTEQILNMDYDAFNNLTKEELKAVVQQISKTANARLKRLEDKELSTPATAEVSRSGGKFTTAKKNINQLRAEYVRAKNFLTAETSTERGFNTFKQKTLEGLGKDFPKLTDKQFERMWKAYDLLKETDPSVTGQLFKYNALREIAAEVRKGSRTSPQTIVRRMLDRLDEIYESEYEDEYDDISEFFDEE